MPIDRSWWNALIDDDGSGYLGTIWNKATIKGLLDSIDGCGPLSPWTPFDASGAGLVMGASAASSFKLFNAFVIATFNVSWPVNSNPNQAKIGGLPIGVQGSNDGGGSCGYVGTPFVPILLPLSGTTTIALYGPGGAGISNSQMSGAGLAGVVLYRML